MKKALSLLISAALAAGLLAGCAGGDSSAQASSASTPAASSSSAPSAPSSSAPESTPGAERTAIRLAGLKGPTSMGMVGLLDGVDAGTALHDYTMNVYGAADELNAKLISGEVDVAALPANAAAVLYNKTGGKIVVAALNTLGVLYVVETGDTIQSIEDLRGKTVYSTGKGTAPEYVFNYILRQNGLDPDTDLTIEYKSEATEVAALLKDSTDAIAVLPQPYATIVQSQNEALRTALDLTEEWEKVSPESGLVTGVLVARAEFVAQNEAAFLEFLQEYKASIEFVNANPAEAAALVAQYGIFDNAAVVEKALHACNIVYEDGAGMKAKLSGYLEVLFEQKPEAVGGVMPDDAFYYGA